MNIIATADLHLTDNRTEEYRHTFMREHLPEIIANSSASALLINGDITEAKDRHSSVLVNKVVSHLAELSALVKVVVMMGNHDYANEGEPFFRFVKELPGVYFVNRPMDWRDLPKSFRASFDGCLFLPHSRDPQREWDGFDFHDWRWIFAHQAFQDADIGFGRKLDGVPTEWFDSDVIAGDIHKPQQLNRVTYIGAPYTIDFGDDYKSRVLEVGDKSWRAIPTDRFPQKRLVRCAPGEDLLDYESKVNPGDFVRVRVDVDTMDGWKEIAELVHHQANKLEIKIERVEPVLLRKTKRHSIKPVSGDSKRSDAELVKQFGDRLRLSDAVLDVGLDIVEGA